jgi:hypothetical protein
VCEEASVGPRIGEFGEERVEKDPLGERRLLPAVRVGVLVRVVSGRRLSSCEANRKELSSGSAFGCAFL